MIRVEFEQDGKRYGIVIYGELEQACHCGVSDWRPDDPVRAKVTGTRKAPDGEDFVYADVEVYCGGCGERSVREKLLTTV